MRRLIVLVLDLAASHSRKAADHCLSAASSHASWVLPQHLHKRCPLKRASNMGCYAKIFFAMSG
eukprot:5923204-Amphidinium_carterae.1